MDPTGDQWWNGVPAALVTGLLTLAATSLAWWLKQKKGKYIDVSLSSHVTLLSVQPSVRDKIVTTFEGRLVKELSLSSFYVRNSSPETIRDIDILIACDDKTTILSAVDTGSTNVANKVTVENNLVTVHIARLNSFRLHKEIAEISILCDGDSKNLVLTGSGDGWSVRKTVLNSAVGLRKPVGAIIAILLLLGIASGLNSMTQLFPSADYPVLHTFLSGVSAFVVLGAIGFAMWLTIEVFMFGKKRWLGES